MFSFISQNWRAKPLVSDRVIVDLVGATTTKTGPGGWPGYAGSRSSTKIGVFRTRMPVA